MLDWTEAVVIEGPAALPVTIDQARAHVRADSSEDTLLAFYLESAVDLVQAYTGLFLLNQTVQISRAKWRDVMHLSVGPVTSVALSFLDSSGAAQNVAGSAYAVAGLKTLDTNIHLLRGQSWPQISDHPEAITATLQVGYGSDGSAVPAAIRQAILLLVGDYYMQREDTIAERSVAPATLPNGVASLLANKRVW